MYWTGLFYFINHLQFTTKFYILSSTIGLVTWCVIQFVRRSLDLPFVCLYWEHQEEDRKIDLYYFFVWFLMFPIEKIQCNLIWYFCCAKDLFLSTRPNHKLNTFGANPVSVYLIFLCRQWAMHHLAHYPAYLQSTMTVRLS